MDVSSIVTTFNNLPRTEMAASGLVRNDWNLSIRHVPIHPPGDLVFMINPASEYVHCEGPIPPNLDSETRDLLVATLILKGYNTAFGLLGRDPRLRSLAPWSWRAGEAALAEQLSRAFRSLGVKAELCTVGVAGSAENAVVDERWDSFLTKLRQASRR